MTKEEAYKLFNILIQQAKEELISFTTTSPLSTQRKADKSLVTGCDKKIDEKLSDLARNAGLQVVSEEGEHVLDIVRSGNYITIDPIDGTLGYIDYVNYALENVGIQSFLQKDLGPTSDFSLLLGIVEDGKPRFGAVYNYITKEKILIDSNDRNALLRENNVRNYNQKYAVYVDQREENEEEKKLLTQPDISAIRQATLGLKSIYTILNPHESAITIHKVQSSGLWDILPAAVATQAFGGKIYDGNRKELKLNEYIILPEVGTIVVKGNKFEKIEESI